MNYLITPIALIAQDWSDGHATSTDYLEWIAFGASFLLGFAFLALVLRGLLRRDRYRAVDVLGEAELAELSAEIERAEETTSGEVVVVVVERSDRHPGAPWVAGIMMLLLGSAASARWMPWDSPSLFFGLQVIFAAAGMLAAHFVPGFRRVFVTEERATEMAEEQSIQEFNRYGLHKTVGQTGVLLFVSLFERRVIVLGDEGIDAVLSKSHWEATTDAILDGIRKGSLAEGLQRGLKLSTAVLTEHFPPTGENPNEVPDHVIVRAE
ncbi:MAG: putative membrane protein [Planctomycetota bacterium]|jgi:putative membrane protein